MIASFIFAEQEIVMGKKEQDLHFLNDTTKAIYEFHLTVQTDDLDGFREFCSQLNVKPIILDLQDRQGNTVMHDVMTSSYHEYPTQTVIDPCVDILVVADKFKNAGFRVVRRKIETTPWHKNAKLIRVHDEGQMPNGSYAEQHVKILIKNFSEIETIKKIAHETKSHLSRNPRKVFDDGSYIQMLTLRSTTFSNNLFEFDEIVANLEHRLHDSGLKFKTGGIEFVIVDSNLEHDASWQNEK